MRRNCADIILTALDNYYQLTTWRCYETSNKQQATSNKQLSPNKFLTTIIFLLSLLCSNAWADDDIKCDHLSARTADDEQCIDENDPILNEEPILLPTITIVAGSQPPEQYTGTGATMAEEHTVNTDPATGGTPSDLPPAPPVKSEQEIQLCITNVNIWREDINADLNTLLHVSLANCALATGASSLVVTPLTGGVLGSVCVSAVYIAHGQSVADLNKDAETKRYECRY